jgi:hypothetical protein
MRLNVHVAGMGEMTGGYTGLCRIPERKRQLFVCQYNIIIKKVVFTLDSAGSRYAQMVDSCEHGKGGKFMIKYPFLNYNFAAWSLLASIIDEYLGVQHW